MSDGFFSRAAGQQRRAALDNALSGFANRYLGPTGIPERLNALAELFPVAEMERGSLAAQRVAGADNWQDRVAGTGDVLSAVAAVVAPGLALNRVGSGPAVALSESLAGVSSSPTAQGAREMGARFVADEFGGMGRGAADEVSQRGAQIMDLLRSGRGADVTDSMLDLGDPVLNTRLNQWLFDNYDLPMDQASRMERAAGMGFDTETPLYHGTGADFQAFYDARRGNFFTDRPEIADIYAAGSTGGSASIRGQASNAGANYMPVSLRGPSLTVSDVGPDGSHGWNTDNIAAVVAGVEKTPLGTFPRRLNEAAKGQGFSTIRIDDMLDLGGEQTQWMSLDPSGIRSRFARFDPRLAHLRNLSAGVAGLGLANALAPADYTADPQEIRNYLAGL